MEKRHLIEVGDLTAEDIDSLCRIAREIKNNADDYFDACRNKIMATLFYEPSTRTQLSFQTAMYRLGGRVIGFSDASNSSVAKGESLRDTVKIVSGYSDITVIRHPIEGAAFASSLYSRTPVINAGDGGHQHPTQTLTDLFTISLERGSPDSLTVGLCGDLLNGRTVHSLILALIRYKIKSFVFISTKELRVPDYIIDAVKKSGIEFVETDGLSSVIGDLDVLYMTRIQRERFASIEQYEKQAGIFVLDREKMKLAKNDLSVLHPLPKVDEIAPEVDDDARARYFAQAENGMYIRMALIMELIKKGKTDSHPAYAIKTRNFCQNPRCISNYEKYLPELTEEADGVCHCKYCSSKIN